VACRTLRRVFGTLDADVVTVVRWRAGALDRLLDEGHADIVGRMVTYLVARGWTVIPEATYSEWGERGSIDILAWHQESRTLLVIEVKTEIASVEELLRRHDVKVRLAPRLAEARFGARPATTARLLVLSASATNRRRVERMDAALGAAYPMRGSEVRAWLRRPDGALSGLLFVGGGTANRRPTSARRMRRPADTRPAASRSAPIGATP
jgi:hypothetical protein